MCRPSGPMMSFLVMRMCVSKNRGFCRVLLNCPIVNKSCCFWTGVLSETSFNRAIILIESRDFIESFLDIFSRVSM